LNSWMDRRKRAFPPPTHDASPRKPKLKPKNRRRSSSNGARRAWTPNRGTETPRTSRGYHSIRNVFGAPAAAPLEGVGKARRSVVWRVPDLGDRHPPLRLCV